MMFVVQHLICRRSRWLYFFLFLSFRVYRERRSSWWLLLFFSLCIKKGKMLSMSLSMDFQLPSPSYGVGKLRKTGQKRGCDVLSIFLQVGSSLHFFLFSPTPIRVLLYYDDALPFSHFYFHRFRLILLIWWQLSGTLSLATKWTIYICISIQLHLHLYGKGHEPRSCFSTKNNSNSKNRKIANYTHRLTKGEREV